MSATIHKSVPEEQAEMLSSDRFAPFREEEFAYFEQVRALRQSPHVEVERAALHQLYAMIHDRLQILAQEVQGYTRSLRDDLELSLPPEPNKRLPRQIFFTLTRSKQKPKQDAALYLALREEGLEVGFGFGLRRVTGQSALLQKFRRQVNRQHRKSGAYLKALQQRDYRLWSEPFQPFPTPSMTTRAWKDSGQVVVRLLDRGELHSLGAHLPSVVAQLFGELMGWYGFLDRVYTEIPHIRPLHIDSFDDPGSLPPDDDVYAEHSATQSLLLDFQSYARSHQLDFPLDIVRTYYLSLQTRPFVILSGVAGTGKSKLALLLARFLTLDSQEDGGNPHVAFIPVRPDWLDPHALLGYYDTLASLYRTTPFLELLLRAHHDPDSPYFVILDEMNLARVEYYLADILSLLETRIYQPDQKVTQMALYLHDQPEPLHIQDSYGTLLALPPQLPLPTNLYITGTVNMDETTHRLSPKVLDRANLIEMTSPSPTSFLHNLYLNPTGPPGHRSPAVTARQRVAFCRNGEFTAPYQPEQLTLRPEHLAVLASSLEAIVQVLAPAGFAFGLRVMQEIVDFGENLTNLCTPHPPDLEWWLDHQLLQKILPRLHGSRQQLFQPLALLLQLCWPQRLDPKARKSILTSTPEPSQITPYQERALQPPTPFPPTHDLPAPDLPLSARKIARMLEALQNQPYVDFHLLS